MQSRSHKHASERARVWIWLEKHASSSDAVALQVSADAIVYPDDHPRTRLVKEVVSALSDQVHKLEHLPSHLRNIDWRVTVVESKTVNAMAAPGGRIIVFAGVCTLILDLA